MTIQEYIDAVAAQLDLPERVVQRIRRDLENELFELVQAGADQQQAIEKMGPVEEAAAKLNEKYADTRPRPKEQQGEMPLLLPWCLLFSVALLVFKGAAVLMGSRSIFDLAVAAAGLVLTAISAAAMLRYRKK